MTPIGDDVAAAIRASGLTIYDDLSERPEAFYDIKVLEARLNEHLVGLTWNYPQKTRSKVAKKAIAEVLGYPVPKSFKKTKPRFPGQNFDTSVQMRDNFQPWNEPPEALRRYVLIRVDPDGVVTGVRVITGEVIALWDRTGTLTSKYQAKRIAGRTGSKLVSASDTRSFISALHPVDRLPAETLQVSAASRPTPGHVLTVSGLYDLLTQLEGIEFIDPGVTKDRSRGALFQQIVCAELGLGAYGDHGQFPDILSQALEVKLQLSTTVDLGLVLPGSDAPAQELGQGLCHADARYAVAYGSRVGEDRIRIDAVVVSTGSDFFTEFQRFEGKVQNRKQQIRLPRTLFDAE